MPIVNADVYTPEIGEIPLDPEQRNKLNQAHTHTNKDVLDATTASFTEAEKSKLANLSERFQGIFNDLAAAEAALPTPTGGWYFLNAETSTIWVYAYDPAQEVGYWEDSGASSAGDMFATVYDPQNIGEDVYDRTNHTGTQPISSVTDLTDTLNDLDTRTSSIPNMADMIRVGKYSTSDSPAASTSTLWTDTDGGFEFTVEAASQSPRRLVITNKTGSGRYVHILCAERSLTSTSGLNDDDSTDITEDIDSSAVGSVTREYTIVAAAYGGGSVVPATVYKVITYRHDSDEWGVTIMRLFPVTTF